MRRFVQILITIAAVAFVLVHLYSKKRRQTNNVLLEVAEAGYETAEDILFPLKSQRLSRRYKQ